MKNYILLLFLGITGILNAQIMLDIHEIKKEQSEWCWAAASKCVLAYYGHLQLRQCDIAEYVRRNGIFNYMGITNCCVDPSNLQGCNQGTSCTGGSGSIQDILVEFGDINNNAFSALTSPLDIEWQLKKQCPLIMRWTSLSDPNHHHAMVIYGRKLYDIIYYMDPDFGYQDLPYNQLLNDGCFEWTLTLVPYDSPSYPWHCYNGIPDGDEEGVDCGGSCPPCYTPPPPPPVDCSNCKWEDGEEEIDCGGPCPPCKDLPEERIIENSQNLPSEVMATKKITAKDATTVKSGQKVSFTTEETGSIVLLPGFKADQGSEFSTQMKDLSKYSRICGKICTCEYISKYHVRPPYNNHPLVNNLHIYNLLYAVKIEYEIYDEQGRFIYSDVLKITSNGRFKLWDCETGAIITQGEVTYKINYTVHYCNETKKDSTQTFVVTDGGRKLLSEKSDELGNPDTFLSPPANNITLQDENATPNFTIIPNPNSGTFQIETNFPLSDIVNLKITNLSGALIYETQTLSSNTIQLPASASGQHFVIVTLKAGAVLTQKMMLQR